MSFIKLKLPMTKGMTRPQMEAKLAVWAKATVNGGEVKEIDRQEHKDSDGNINRIDVTIENTYRPTPDGLPVNGGDSYLP
jgi:hypothetical protein